MQTKYTILLLVLLINLKAQSQTKTVEEKETSESNSDKNYVRAKEAEYNVLKAFEAMIKGANDNYKKSNSIACDAEKLLPKTYGRFYFGADDSAYYIWW